MMRKFAVTVFALSLTALGCGSDSGTPAVDAQPDGAKSSGVEVGSTKFDVAQVPDVGTPSVEVGTGVEASIPDVAKPTDVAQLTEVGTTSVEAGKADVAPTVEAGGPRVDGGSVDGSIVDAPSQPDVPAVDAAAVDAGVSEAGLAADAGTAG